MSTCPFIISYIYFPTYHQVYLPTYHHTFLPTYHQMYLLIISCNCPFMINCICPLIIKCTCPLTIKYTCPLIIRCTCHLSSDVLAHLSSDVLVAYNYFILKKMYVKKYADMERDFRVCVSVWYGQSQWFTPHLYRCKVQVYCAGCPSRGYMAPTSQNCVDSV